MKKMVCIIVVLLVAMVNVASANLLAHWTFDSDWSDSAGTFDLTAANGASIDTDGGVVGGAASFSRASSQYASVNFTQNAMFDPTEDFTVMAWYQFNVADIGNTTDRYFVFESGNYYTASYGLRDLGSGDVGQVYTQNTTGAASNMTFTESPHQTWHHIAITYNHSTGVFNAYLDGSFVKTMTRSGTLQPSTFFVVGGHKALTGRNWEGLIDDVAVFDNIVSTTDIAYYAAGHAVPEPATVCLLTLGSLLFARRRHN